MSGGRTRADSVRSTAAPVEMVRLWYGVLVGIVAWKLQLMVIYALVPFACWNGLAWIGHVATIATALLSLSGALVGWRSWTRSRARRDPALDEPMGRSGFLALSGVALGIFFAFVIVGQWLPNLFLGPCDGIA